MLATIHTILPGHCDQLWQEIRRIESLRYIAAPLLSLSALGEKELPDCWSAGETYRFKLALFGFLPLGSHSIFIEEIDEQSGLIYTQEHGSLAKVWNHEIRFNEQGEGQIAYSDTIEIRAGVLTLPIWLFAHVFYRHRQRRWKKLLKSKAAEE